MTKIVELTKENENKYLYQIAELEEIVLQQMKKEGREGQLFSTDKEDISEYVHSSENTVLIAENEKGEVEGTTFITQGQQPFTYNDITKYFKYGEEYKQYVKSEYENNQEYKKHMLGIYQIKIKAFEYARERILKEHPEKSEISEFLEQEIKENGFHEKSELREKVNKYMSEYISRNYGQQIQNEYEQFYWITSDDISQEFERKIGNSQKSIKEYEQFMQSQYDEILNKGKLIIYEKPEFNVQNYYSANTKNSVELDTYITLPENRSAGIARIIVYEGIKKHIEKHFSNPKNKEIFLCSTLHRDNLSSKYVSEFFGLTDSLYVNRRQGRDREVHICKIPREKAMEYLTAISDKLAVLYDYNPQNKHISETTKRKVLKEQLEYEKREHDRLVNARTINKTLKGINIKFIENKSKKIQRLQRRLEEVSIPKGDKNYE